MTVLGRSAGGLIAAGALAITACGENDEGAARAVVERLTRGDPGVCRQMTNEFREIFGGSVRACGKRIRAARREEFEIQQVTVRGGRATVGVTSGEWTNVLTLVQRQGTWKISHVSAREVDAEHPTSAAPDGASRPDKSRRLNPRETVEAYYRAIKEANGAALCGLLSKRHAAKVLGRETHGDPLAACADALESFDWSMTQEKAAGVKPRRVFTSDGKAAVTLSSGKRALLKKYQGRWAIDDIVR